MSGRKRTGRPTASFSNGMSTMRPRIDTPSLSRTTPTAEGTSAACARGATRITVKLATVPSPASATGCHWCAWQLGHSSFGGMASSPQAPQRMAVSCPPRAFSKKTRAVVDGSVTAEETHEDGRGGASEGVGEALLRALDLARAGLAAQLRHDLRHLCSACRADWMAFRLEAARRVHRDLPAQAREALLGRAAARARLEEAQALRGDDLGDREAIVQLDDVDVR